MWRTVICWLATYLYLATGRSWALRLMRSTTKSWFRKTLRKVIDESKKGQCLEVKR